MEFRLNLVNLHFIFTRYDKFIMCYLENIVPMCSKRKSFKNSHITIWIFLERKKYHSLTWLRCQISNVFLVLAGTSESGDVGLRGSHKPDVWSDKCDVRARADGGDGTDEGSAQRRHRCHGGQPQRGQRALHRQQVSYIYIAQRTRTHCLLSENQDISPMKNQSGVIQ